MSESGAKEFDVVLYGASGFTGRQTAEYFQKHAPANLRFAIAGRNQAKLEAVHRELGLPPTVGVIAADITAMVARARIVLTTAGPYTLYGAGIVRACAEAGVHYVDITGETVFIRDMIDAHEDAARASGAVLLPLCGFDSVPADLGAYLAQKALRENHSTGTRRADGYYTLDGGFNGGTFYSAMQMYKTGAYKRMRDPELLLPPDAQGVAPAGDARFARYAPEVNSWVAPFIMAKINTRVVHRSAALAAAAGQPYGDRFAYTESMRLGGAWNPVPALAVAAGMQSFEVLGPVAAIRGLLETFAPAPGEGPSAKTIERGVYQLEVVAVGENGDRVRVTIADERDPGNRATVQFACESALELARLASNSPEELRKRIGGGFRTPATAIGDALVARLIAGGVRIASEGL